MATKKTYSEEVVKKLKKRLKEMQHEKPKVKEFATDKIIETLKDEIKILIDMKYTYGEIVDEMHKVGFDAAERTIKQYIRKAIGTKRKKNSPKSPGEDADTNGSVEVKNTGRKTSKNADLKQKKRDKPSGTRFNEDINEDI